MLLVGCTGNTEVIVEEEETDGIPDENIEQGEEGPIPEVTIEVGGSELCDNTNPDHCLLPFPSSAFLEIDSSTETGYRLNIEGGAIPDSGSAPSERFHMLDLKDGHSPSTQIFTTFTQTPNVSGLASQHNIEISLSPNHGTVLLNMDTGAIMEHWIEVSARSQEGESTLVHLRTLGGLDLDTQYAVAFRGLTDLNGDYIEAFSGFKALRDGQTTNSQVIEDQRAGYEELFASLSDVGFERSTIQSSWWFHTASANSIMGDIIHMRDDASERLGDDGIGCNVTSV